MAPRLRTGVASAVLSTVAMGLHSVLTDRSLEEHHPRRFPRGGRLLLAEVFAPSTTVVVALLTALLGGSILLDVVKEELPATGRSGCPWFLVGLVLYGGLLALVTGVGESTVRRSPATSRGGLSGSGAAPVSPLGRWRRRAGSRRS